MRKRLIDWILGLTVVAAVCPAAVAQPRTELAKPTAAGARVVWLAGPDAGAMELRVDDGRTVSTRLFARGQAPDFALTRDDGSTLEDGTYTWELRERMAPINDGVYDPANGRDTAAHDRSKQRVAVEGRVQSGVFTVKNGMVVDASLTEAAEPGGEGK